ncbi:11367_t:CDS:2 [Rhizophagus irregularis]|nr:11367_t:CDS:2 [Rhizophagus irregularis]
MINERLEPKVASFNFGGSAKYGRYFAEGTKVKFSSKCDIFSFSMLLWKIAFDVIPYRNWNYTNIIDRIKADGDNDDPISEATVILPMIQPLLLLEDEEAADSQLRYAFSLYHDQIIKDTDAFLQYLML